VTDPAIPVPPRRLRSPYWHRDTYRLYVGDAREVLAEMPDHSADCIVTSPPYWGKRDYGMARQYGREPDPASYVATLRATFTEARRVLADDGTCWLNLGDSYSASGGGPTGLHTYLGRHLGQPSPAGVPAKNLLGLPWRVAFALQEDGWILRNAIVWHKPNAMPESVRRPAQLPLRAAFPARQAGRLLVRPRPHPYPGHHHPAHTGPATWPPRPRPARQVRSPRSPGHRRQSVRAGPGSPRPPQRA
jgi:hypothetical protein